MSEQRINLIDGVRRPKKMAEVYYQKPVKQKKGRWVFRLLIFVLALAIFFSTNVIFSKNSLITNLGRLSFWEGVARLMVGRDKILKGELFDRTNILILGMGGAQHEGPYLTDTIILVSLKPSTHQIGLLSIPRDLYIPVPGYGWRKINSANALGMIKSNDGGALTSEVVSNVFDLPIHYWLRVDFNIFKELIDELGGVEIEVKKGFSDYQFPGPNFSYRVISFEAGWQLMDGQTALEFARSRHGDNNEDSDFARARRQQKILFAIKEKIEQEKILSQPRKTWYFYNILKDHLSTNLDLSQAIRLAKLVSGINQNNIITQVIEAEPNGPLKSEIGLNGSFVLRPKTGNFKELAKIAENILNQSSIPEPRSIASSLQGKQSPFGKQASGLIKEQELLEASNKEKPKIIILNGTYVTGLAKQVSEELKNQNFEVVQIGNAPTKDYKENLIYQVNPSQDNLQLKDLQEILNGEIEQELNQELKDLFNNQADFLIILGKE